MREIKFRAWDKRVKCFYYFSLKDLWAEGCEAQLSELDDPKHLALNTDYPYEEEEQYAGLKDKNTKEVYEKDIYDFGKGNVGEVVFEDSSFFVDLPHGKFKLQSGGQIIGNIHENPELIKEE